MKKARINEFKVSLMSNIKLYRNYFAEKIIDFEIIWKKINDEKKAGKNDLRWVYRWE